MAPPPFDAELGEAWPLASNVKAFRFRALGTERFDFVPGQWVSFSLPIGKGAPEPKAYSIASPPDGTQRFELAVTHVTGGPASEFLHALAPGARLHGTGPQGFFTLDRVPERPALFVGTGTGVAPLRSMIEWALAHGATTPMTLLFGVRTQDDLLYGADFERLARAHANFRFVPTLSRPKHGWTGQHGYVQTHLAALLGDRSDADVYVCGVRKMVDDVRRILRKDLGFPRERVHYERYD